MGSLNQSSLGSRSNRFLFAIAEWSKRSKRCEDAPVFLTRQVQRFDVGIWFCRSVYGGGVGEGLAWPRFFINSGGRAGPNDSKWSQRAAPDGQQQAVSASRRQGLFSHL